jgi:3-hydroxyacyl-[acyl-carrier-protein] dehydratase
VAASPLIDISSIDLSQVLIPPEEVERLNPQRGPMRQLDHVIWASENATRGLGVKHVRDDEFWVEYHIPGRPLMPGVLMIEAAAQLCSILQQLRLAELECKFLGFTRCDDVAFRGQVVPGDTLYLMAREVKSNRRRFTSIAQGWVEDQLVLEAQITGMVM